ncbi:hypothetical protein V8J88_08320 [Massilia sp. W12]|uniref:hypothetical protein n=1 Tax=Massilia sp. W12 TaxID=3126507 RepID=UPI0030D4DBC7
MSDEAVYNSAPLYVGKIHLTRNSTDLHFCNGQLISPRARNCLCQKDNSKLQPEETAIRRCYLSAPCLHILMQNGLAFALFGMGMAFVPLHG